MKSFLFLLIFFGFSTLHAQTSFPDNWIGNYKGDLMIYSADSVRMQVTMHLDIAKTEKDSVYNWTITYDPNGRNDRRAYELVLVDKDKGHYQIDEKNSIVLDCYLRNQKILTSFFKVSDSFVMTTETMQDDGTILFEVIAGDAANPNRTGNSSIDGEEIPQVLSYKVTGRQKAILRKQ